jgi:hypothetical protein
MESIQFFNLHQKLNGILKLPFFLHYYLNIRSIFLPLYFVHNISRQYYILHALKIILFLIKYTSTFHKVALQPILLQLSNIILYIIY